MKPQSTLDDFATVQTIRRNQPAISPRLLAIAIESARDQRRREDEARKARKPSDPRQALLA